MVCAPLSAQQVGSIQGVVYDKDLDAPLAGAQVLNLESQETVISSKQGIYAFTQVPPGKYTLIFSKDGFVNEVKADVLVQAGKVSDVNASLAAEITEMEEFIVQDTLRLDAGSEAALLSLRFDSPSLMNAISSDLMSRAGASDAAGALRLVAGATVKDGKSAVIRGLPDRYVSSLMNGMRLPSADDDKRAVELDQFPSPVIETIQVRKTFTPDMQGDASGGAVDVRLKGIPEETFFQFKSEISHNTQVTGRRDFLSYDGGGISFWGRDGGRRDPQIQNIGANWDGAVGTSTEEAPTDHKWSMAFGGKHELEDGVKIGATASFFYERDSAFYDDGVDDSLWVETPGGPMVPKTFQGAASGGDFKTGLFDVTKGSQMVQWGGLAAFGLETENNSLNLAYLFTRTTEDTATLAVDTRGKEYFFPGYDPSNPSTPGHNEPDAAPYIRNETLEYTERETQTLQLHGEHTLPIDGFGPFEEVVLDWTLAYSTADLYQPDKRQFGALWKPERSVGPITIPSTWFPYKPGANFTLGNLQRIWKEIEEESYQGSLNLKLPFEQWSGEEGYLKVGLFHDEVDRTFDQDTFSNFGDNSTFQGPWNQPWSSVFPFENHPITESEFDVDYDGNQKISAAYLMMDLPLLSNLNLIGGVRFESTDIDIVNHPESAAIWYPPGATAPVQLNPGEADVSFSENDILPSIGLKYEPIEDVSLRGSISRTIARQTFKELTPIIQQEFLGGPIFIGNPELEMSQMINYDLRLDYTPYDGGLFSLSWFHKDINNPIEYVQRIASFTYTTAVNYPEGRLNGWELEARQEIGHLLDPLEGLTLGANATFIDSKVDLPKDEIAGFNQPNIQAPMSSRDMTNAPEHLYNLYMTYELPRTGTQFGLFYTVTGDTLVTGAAESNGNYVPNIYAEEFDTLNLSVTQRLNEYVKLSFKAKNLTNPEIDTVYRSKYIGTDENRSSYRRGVDYSISLSAEFRF